MSVFKKSSLSWCFRSQTLYQLSPVILTAMITTGMYFFGWHNSSHSNGCIIVELWNRKLRFKGTSLFKGYNQEEVCLWERWLLTPYLPAPLRPPFAHTGLLKTSFKLGVEASVYHNTQTPTLKQTSLPWGRNNLPFVQVSCIQMLWQIGKSYWSLWNSKCVNTRKS